MEESTYRSWDVTTKALGFIATAAAICVGIWQFNRQQEATMELEFKRNFWQKQNQVYAEVCRNAGAMAASINDQKAFDKDKQTFLSLYYGDLVLVEDQRVDSMMREIKSYVDILEPKDPNMVNVFKRKVLGLAEACKASSATFKQANLQ
jgi:hypothetical protein